MSYLILWNGSIYNCMCGPYTRYFALVSGTVEAVGLNAPEQRRQTWDGSLWRRGLHVWYKKIFCSTALVPLLSFCVSHVLIYSHILYSLYQRSEAALLIHAFLSMHPHTDTFPLTYTPWQPPPLTPTPTFPYIHILMPTATHLVFFPHTHTLRIHFPLHTAK